MKRKMTAEEATALNLEPFADYYEFGDDGTCVSLRDGRAIGNATGSVCLSGKIRTTNAALIKIIAYMYLGIRDFKNNKIYCIDGDVTNNGVENIGVMPMKEWIAKRAAEREPRQRFGKEKKRTGYLYSRTFKQASMSNWYRNNT